jgi:hypothetical protein
MDVPQPRKLRPALALLAGFAEFGLGYVYVGRIHLGLAAFAAFYGAIALLTWTRLITSSPLFLWLAYVVGAVLMLTVLIHPVVIAATLSLASKCLYRVDALHRLSAYRLKQSSMPVESWRLFESGGPPPEGC